ncbi:MAG: glycine--tRNA ligase subunit beta [candidate division WOR-3 bacterium]|nr:MAG: glycine--tRNA ligase subunit beta [candidate division WOR-3 bacterium]
MLEMLPFLLEVGTEEVPQSFLRPAAEQLSRLVQTLLEDAGIGFEGTLERFWTLRRIAVMSPAVRAAVPAHEVEVQGPPRKAAFDSDGKPTRTARGFAKSQGCRSEDLYVNKTDRGEYVFARKTVPEFRTADILANSLPKTLAAVEFPKTMRWLADGTRFPRPVRWLVCMLGSEAVEFEFAGLRAGRTTRGHRNSEQRVVELTSPAEYEHALAKANVVVSPERRRQTVVTALKKLAASVNAEPVLDEELLEETVNITEWPVPILSRFRAEHLELPAEVLVTALKKHQRCFALRNEERNLVPHFVAVANTPDCDAEKVGRWYEDAAESRFEDAGFFFQADIRTGLETLVETEKRVTWIEGMGSYFDKTQRLRAICQHLARAVPEADETTLDRAALLCKADLLTNMVREKEFTSLQGVIGGIYARLQGETDAVADAISEHYRPQSSADRLPATAAGAVLSIADKTDNIVATFLTGQVPTGSEDPFALRRQAAGLLAIILNRNLAVDIPGLVRATLGLFADPDPKLAGLIPDFFLERETQAMAERDVPYDIAQAVLATSGSLPARALATARALLHFRTRPEFEKLVIGQKRVANILRDQDVDGDPDPKLFAEPAEKELYQQAVAVAPELAPAVAGADFDKAFELLLGLRPPIDRLFDEVLVMAEDQRLRANRLRLLLFVRSLFREVADLSKVVIEGEPASA